MTTPKNAAHEGTPFVNYNVRYRDELDPVRAWRDATNTPMQAFTNFDGGGFNFYICEFKTLEDAEAFRHHFQIHGEKTLWAEAADGSIHYLPDSKPALTEDTDTSNDPPAPDEANPGPISLRREGFVPITPNVLNLIQHEMELLARGSLLLSEIDSKGGQQQPTSHPTTMTDLAQSVAELTFYYADREATWLNRYNKDDKTVEWTWKEAFYKKRIEELLELISEENLQKCRVILTEKLANPPGEATRSRSHEEILNLIKRFRAGIGDKENDTPQN